jgi:hypothetical protein
VRHQQLIDKAEHHRRERAEAEGREERH